MLQNVLLWENNTFANEFMCKKCCPTWPTFCTVQLIYFLIFFFLVPNPVQNLRVADVQAREITIQWDYPFGPSEFYQVEYYILDSEDHGRPIDTGVTEFSHNRLFPYTTYVYKVYNIVNGVIRSLPQRLEVTTLADGKITYHSYDWYSRLIFMWLNSGIPYTPYTFRVRVRIRVRIRIRVRVRVRVRVRD